MSRVQIPVVAQDAAGNAVSGASITIVNRQTGQAPVVYTTETGGNARSLPLTSGVNGRPPESWVDRAGYLITVQAPAIGTDVMTFDAASGGDATIGTAWLADGAVTNAKVAGNAAIAESKLALAIGWPKTGVGANGLADGAIGVYRGTTYSHIIGAKVAFDTVDYNYGATLSANAISVPFAGLWHVTATVTVSDDNAISGRLFIGPNEVDYAYAPAAPTAEREIHFAGSRPIGVGDAISILFDTTTSILNGRNRTHMNAHCLGRI